MLSIILQNIKNYLIKIEIKFQIKWKLFFNQSKILKKLIIIIISLYYL